jgi:hypothetical protein
MYALFVDAGTSRFDGLVDLQSGQIKFPATQSASADVNTLDDYEEGTWTPSVGGSATYTSQIGTYTKIGRKVTINGTLVINTIGTGSTSNVSGIPFTNTGTTHGTGSVFFTSAATSYVSLVAEVGAGDNFVGFVGLTSAGGSMSTQSPMTSGTTLRFSVTYFV